MSGQYTLNEKQSQRIKNIIQETISDCNGDLFEDNDVSIQYAKKREHEGKSWFYVQIN